MRSIRLLLIGFLLLGVSSCGRGVAVTEPERELDRLLVVDRPGDDGTYRRAAFGPAWADTDHNSCNQRDDALFAAVDKSRPFTVRRQDACDHDMISGTWPDPYSDQSMTFGDLKDQEQARALPIDHIVALAVSWRYGADNWTPCSNAADQWRAGSALHRPIANLPSGLAALLPRGGPSVYGGRAPFTDLVAVLGFLLPAPPQPEDERDDKTDNADDHNGEVSVDR